MIQVANISDFRQISQMMRQTFYDAFSGEMEEGHMDSHLAIELSDKKILLMLEADDFLLASSDGKAVGFVQVGEVNEAYSEYISGVELRSFDLELRRAYVLAPYQNQGHGQKLMDAALTFQSKRPEAHIFLDVWETNEGAQRFYRKNGFDLVGKMPEANQHGQITGYEHIMVRRSAVGS